MSGDYTLYDREYEERVVGCALTYHEFLLEVDDLGVDRCRWVYQAAKDLQARGDWDFEELTNEIYERGQLKDIGGAAYLNELVSKGEPPTFSSGYVLRIKKLAELRRAKVFGENLVKAVARDKYDPAEFIRQFQEIRRETQSSKNGTVRFSVKELFSMDIPDLHFIIPDLLPVGAVILAGRPKIGKSWLALQIAHSVGTGGIALDRKVDQKRVLYVALEDPPRRLKKRLLLQKVPERADITFLTTFPVFGAGGFEELQREISDGYSLIVIDTLSRALGMADQLDLGRMTTIIGDIQNLASSSGVCILLIDHHRKNAGFESSPVDDILGSTGKAATVDAIWGLYREKGKREATLSVTGREMEETELALQWDGEMYCWHSLGDAGAVRVETAQGRVLNAINELIEMGELATTTRIATHLGINKGHTSRTLSELIEKGKIKRGEKTGRDVPYYPIVAPDI